MNTQTSGCERFSLISLCVVIATSLLQLCDGLRDDQLPELGVLLEDREGHTVVKYVGREVALKEKENAKEVCLCDVVIVVHQGLID